ncbi:prolipoprotein diacylglyceryl transferase family protein [Desulfuromonas thiophila]|uniref:prolipoprotein diacylglyceryl transferase family protein n=1 Tax=Desulfuromonas thiophila TaxID=57664 RepID=UPI0024A8D615|nr:prolipoprotein diacylglyceryl transferase family protein [Desulfuromonas thiophila]
MTNLLILLVLALLSGFYLLWGCRVLPHEGWQFIAAVPLRRVGPEQWQGCNLTYYGLLTANAYVAALLLLLLALQAVGVASATVALLGLALLGLCVPASRLVAQWVEGKAHTFTVGGAVFVGILAAPWLVLAINAVAGRQLLPPLATLAALALAYAFGEGFGRLACISFGCCYGRPLAQSGPLIRRLFGRFPLVFEGTTRKIAYASGLENTAVVPVQALTALLYVGAGLMGLWLYSRGAMLAALLLATLVTQGWRLLSELLRADYRGDRRFSAYQWMALLSLFYLPLVASWLPPGPQLPVDLLAGLRGLWHPAILVLAAVLWWLLFLYTGCSRVTGAILQFHVRRERI